MKKNRPHILQAAILLLAMALVTAGPAGARKDKQKSNTGEFDKVDYLFGPTARTTREHVGGEVARGILRFDGEAKILSFTTDKGPNLNIPYNRIRELAVDDKSLMRSGALAAGVVVAPFIRQHKHFLTIHYTDDKGASRTALFQLDKSNYEEVGKAAGETARIASEASAGAAGKAADAAPASTDRANASPSTTSKGIGAAQPAPASPADKHAGAATFRSLEAEAASLGDKDWLPLQARAKAGDLHAMTLLPLAEGMALSATGHGDVPLESLDPNRTLWTAQAAEKGYAPAQYLMGKRSHGADAAEWYRKAGLQGDPDAQQALGSMYVGGEDGVKTDYMEACRWFHLAAEQGPEFGYSQAWLGMYYALDPGQGSCVNRDLIEAAKWLRIGIEGLTLAKDPMAAHFQKVANALLISPAESAEADRRIAEWHKKMEERAGGGTPAAVGTKP